MALRASAALGALLLALPSAALPSEGAGDDADTQCFLATRASAPSAELKQRPRSGSIVDKYETLGTEVVALEKKLAEYKASHPSSTSTTCCAGSKQELGNRLSELEKWAEELAKTDPEPAPSATPCMDKVQSEWDEALSDFDFKGQCRNADYTEQTIKKGTAVFGSECHGSGSAKVESLLVRLKYECYKLCTARGVEVGKILASQFCNREKIFLDNFWMADGVYPPLEGGYNSGTIVDDCHGKQQAACKKQLTADGHNCEEPRAIDEDFAKAITFCDQALDALNP